MKNLSKYTAVGLLAMLLALIACGDSKKETAENNKANPEMENEHSDGEARK